MPSNCSKACQKKHWKRHKPACLSLHASSQGGEASGGSGSA